ncbi:hypothetical protein [Streptomyces sp. MZ04]|uniref:hypothetical protein n=1 Tax=Streptomyces sp. MZ04 TaxID=2559236 RepID=UPI00107E6E59|nr:hypothetical protein [Streptomyces sp. MZ04]TGB10006.1 hypothetical protein E2651_15380 [Streptomyces sp. MZ04]
MNEWNIEIVSAPEAWEATRAQRGIRQPAADQAHADQLHNQLPTGAPQLAIRVPGSDTPLPEALPVTDDNGDVVAVYTLQKPLGDAKAGGHQVGLALDFEA